MGKEEERQKYLVAQAQQVKARLRTPIGLLLSSMDRETVIETLRMLHEGEVRTILAACQDDHLGKIICAAPSISFKKSDTGIVWSGRGAALELATRAILSAVADLVQDEMRQTKAQAESVPKYAHLKCKFCDWTVRKYWREGSRAFSGFTALASHIESKHRAEADKIYAHMGEPEVESE